MTHLVVQPVARSAGLASVASVFLLTWLTGCGQARPTASTEPPPLVEAVEARVGGLPLEESVPGVVRAENQVTVRPEISAVVAEALVESGDTVRKDEILVRLQEGELREQLRRAEADVQLAEANVAESRARTDELETRLRRLRSLASDELVSPQELESLTAQLEVSYAASRASEARVEQALATVDERRLALSKTLVRSPVAGRVGERRAEVGMLVEPGTALFTVGTLERMLVGVTLTEEMLAHLSPGLPVLVRPRDADADWIEAKLTRLSPFLAEESFTTVGEIELDNPEGRLRPGMFVNVRILYGKSDEATLVPSSALWEDTLSGDRGVFVVDDADGLEAPLEGTAKNPDRSRRVSFRRVGVLAEGRGSVAIDGVGAGEWVVTLGQHLLRRNMQDAASEESGEGDTTQARVRPATWERVSMLQNLQREDLLNDFLEKQRRIARALGADIPESEAVVQRALETGGTGGR